MVGVDETNSSEQSSIVHHVSVISSGREEIVFESSSIVSADTTHDFAKESVERSFLTSTPNVVRTHTSSAAEDSRLYESSNDGNSSISLKKCVTLLQSFSMKHDDSTAGEEVEVDTLENHLFPDISYTGSELVYDNQFKTRNLFPESSWNKLHGVSYLPQNTSLLSSDEDEHSGMDCTVNHVNRSHFRQRRREWYLNRRAGTSTKTTHEQVVVQHNYLIMFLSTILTFIYAITYNFFKTVKNAVILTKSLSHTSAKPFLFLLSSLKNIFIFVRKRMSTFFLRMFSFLTKRSAPENEEVKIKSEVSCLGVFCWLMIVITALGALTISYVAEKDFQVPNPMISGIDNAHPFYVDKFKEVPAWHIYPKQMKLSSLHAEKTLLKSTLPVIMFLRNDGDVGDPRLKSIYNTMHSLGYHVIVPTNVVQQSAIIDTWKWIKEQTNATSYLWGFGIDAAILTETAKVLCKHLFPPNGVIIAKEVKSENLPQTMEIWSCNCALTSSVESSDASGSNFKYNHIKCPVAFDSATNDVYSQVVHCIETVNKNVDG